MINLCVLGWSVTWLARQAGASLSALQVWLFVPALAVTAVVAQHLVFGQINILLAALCLYDLTAPPGCRPRFLPQGLLTGLAAGIKLTPGFFLLYLLATKQLRSAAWMSLATGATVLIGGLFFPQPSYDFWTTHVFSLSDKVDLGTNFASSGNNSLSGMLAFFWPGAPGSVKLLILGVTAVVTLFLSRMLWKRGRTLEPVLVVGAGIQLLSPVSWIHHWVFLVFAAVYLLLTPALRRWGIAALVVLWAQPTDLGHWLLSNGPNNPVVLVLGSILREGLLLLTILCGSVLFWAGMRQRPEPAGVEGARAEDDPLVKQLY